MKSRRATAVTTRPATPGERATAERERSAPPEGGSGPAGPGRRSRRAARKGGKRRVLRWVASVLALLIIGTGGAGYVYYKHLNGNIKKADLTLGDKEMTDHKANAAGQTPLNILLIGSDARDSKANQKLGGAKETFGGPRSPMCRCCSTSPRTAATSPCSACRATPC